MPTFPTPFSMFYSPAQLIGAYQVESTAQLPNVSGATLQTKAIQVGSLAWVANALLYKCTVPTLNGATWVLVDALANPLSAASGGSGALLGSFIASDAGVVLAQNFGSLDITAVGAGHTTGTYDYVLTGADAGGDIGITASAITGIVASAYSGGPGVCTVVIGSGQSPQAQIAGNALQAGAVGLTLSAYTPGSGQYDFLVTSAVNGTAWTPVATLRGTAAVETQLEVSTTGSPASGVRVTSFNPRTLAPKDADFTLVLNVAVTPQVLLDAYHYVFVSDLS